MGAPTYIAHGEFAIGESDEAVISATLGSCIAVCLYDEHMGIGGMNHILLPGTSGDDEQRYGYADMERLINALVRGGASRRRLTSKVFGGAAMLDRNSDIGERNAAFALSYLERDGIPCLSQSTGGTQARQVKFFPGSGNVKHRFVVTQVDVDVPRDQAPNDVELF